MVAPINFYLDFFLLVVHQFEKPVLNHLVRLRARLPDRQGL